MAHSIRRQARKVPSVRKHAISAVLVLAVLLLCVYLLVKIQDRQEIQTVGIGSEVVLPEQVFPELEPAAPPLPDLLEGDNIPLDANPTEIIDLMGAPKTENPQNTGPRPPSSGQSASIGPPSKTILIDGSPVSRAQAPLNRSKPLCKGTS